MPHYHVKDAFDYIAAIVPLLAVLVAIGVGVVQLYLQRQQLAQDLFEKRYRIYSATRAFLSAILETWNPADFPKRPEIEMVQELIDSTAHAKFLFGPEVEAAIEAIISKGIHIFHLKNPYSRSDFYLNQRYAQYIKERVEAEEPEAVSNEFEAMRWLEEQRSQLNDLFGPYLQLYHDRLWIVRFIDRLTRWVDSREDVLAAGRVSERS